MSFNKAAQRARAAQNDSAALQNGATIPVLKQPAPKPMTVKVFEGKEVQVGDSVIHPTCSSNSVFITRKTVTKIANGQIFLDGASQAIRVPTRLIKA